MTTNVRGGGQCESMRQRCSSLTVTVTVWRLGWLALSEGI